MNCQSFENNLTDLARQVPLEATVMEEARTHLEACRACASRLDEQRALSGVLRELSLNLRAVSVADRVEQNLIEEFRRQKTAVPSVAAKGRRRWYALAAAAAVLLIVSGGIATRLNSTVDNPSIGSSTPLNVAPAGAPNPQELVAINPVTSVTADNTQPVSHRPVVRRRLRGGASRMVAAKPTPVAAPTVPTEVTTDFMTLGDISTASLQEGAQVFRVEMPRYAMARFGLPVNMERYDEKVKADVWVGMDGLARAIRFVQ
jgi:hypothetical protein